MKQKQSDRITNAIIEHVYGTQSWLSSVHPLHKSSCSYCKAMICEKDMQAHFAEFHEVPEPGEQRDLPPAEEFDEEDSSQSESEGYGNAH